MAQPVRAAHRALRLPRGAHPCSVWAQLASGWQCAEGSPGEMQRGFKSGAGAPTSAAHQHLIQLVRSMDRSTLRLFLTPLTAEDFSYFERMNEKGIMAKL